MNERIKLLAEQAWTMVSDEERTRGELYEADKQRERRDQVFAKLIVRECANIAYHHVMNISTYADAEFVEEQIQTHFGVDE